MWELWTIHKLLITIASRLANYALEVATKLLLEDLLDYFDLWILVTYWHHHYTVCPQTHNHGNTANSSHLWGPSIQVLKTDAHRFSETKTVHNFVFVQYLLYFDPDIFGIKTCKEMFFQDANDESQTVD